MSIVNKMLNLIGFETQDDYEEELIESSEFSNSQGFNDDEIETVGGKNNKVVKIHTTAQLKLVVMQPENFEDARDIANHLKNKKPVVINLENVERNLSQRIVDFLSGAVYALDGNIQKVSNGIFLIAPYNVGIMGDFKDELRNKGIFPWNS
ncbi:MAG: cell division protein SepF [Clostridia bacterium]|nr:cell division protein SepF [Oscillospiraceae bacterium]MBQ7960514.1 cell division protein SepF [Clostridia bacterium]